MTMSKKDSKIEIGSLWKEKDFRNQKIYIVTDIVKHPYFNDSVNLKRVDLLDSPDGTINIDAKYLKLDYRKVG